MRSDGVREEERVGEKRIEEQMSLLFTWGKHGSDTLMYLIALRQVLRC